MAIITKKLPTTQNRINMKRRDPTRILSHVLRPSPSISPSSASNASIGVEITALALPGTACRALFTATCKIGFLTTAPVSSELAVEVMVGKLVAARLPPLRKV